METQARYKLIGIFTLTVILAGFAFVYWLYNTGGIRNRVTYRVEFESSVSGLLVGSAVLFNGLRVGEVSRLQLNPQKPRQVVATIEIDETAPVRPDTIVELEFQGLTGAPTINLVGGREQGAALPATDATPLVLRADPASAENVTRTARNVLRRLDAVLATNAEPLRDVIENFRTFSNALAKNSDRVDGILAGIERLTGGGKTAAKLHTYDLTAPALTTLPANSLAGMLVIEEPSVLIAFNTDKVLIRRKNLERATLDNAKWTDNLPNLIQTKVLRSFENAGYLKFVGRPTDDISAEFRLLLDIRRFEVSQDIQRAADVEILAKVVGESGHVLDGKRITASVPITKQDTQGAIQALDVAFANVVNSLIPWVIRTTNSTPKMPLEAN